MTDYSGWTDAQLRNAAAQSHMRADFEVVTEAKRELLRYVANDINTELARRGIAARAAE